MKDFGPFKEFLGTQVVCHRSKRGLNLSQVSYTEKILERFKITESKPFYNPMVLMDSVMVLIYKRMDDEGDSALPS